MGERPRESSTQAVPEASYSSIAISSGKIIEGCSETIDTVIDTVTEPCAAPENCSSSESKISSLSESESETISGTDNIDQRQPEVILIVGSSESKIGVVELLTKGDSCIWKDETEDGVRILTHKDGRVIVDTTPLDLEYINGKSPFTIARRWISRNSLRRIIVGKPVVVVCVITYSTVEDGRCKGGFLSNAKCWVDVCQLIFKDRKEGIMILVNTDNGDLPKEGMKKIRSFVEGHQFMTKNIICSGDGSVPTILECLDLGKITRGSRVKRVPAFLKELLPRSNKKDPNFTKPSISIMPFHMKEVKTPFGAWGPERVLLFGKTGNGKSTLAQMLIKGYLDPESKVFPYSNSIRGGTRKIEMQQGRGWYVVDTPGFGEPKEDPKSTIPTEEVNRKIQKFVRLVEGTFSHFLFVVKKDRVEQLEIRLWEFFKELFGKELIHQFSIVVSNADNDWLNQNIEHLKNCFEGCCSFLCAEFPSTADENDEELKAEEEAVRVESLKELEKNLAKLGRCDRDFNIGRYAAMNKIEQQERADADAGTERVRMISLMNHTVNLVFEMKDFYSQLSAILTVDNKIALLPFTA